MENKEIELILAKNLAYCKHYLAFTDVGIFKMTEENKEKLKKHCKELEESLNNYEKRT